MHQKAAGKGEYRGDNRALPHAGTDTGGLFGAIVLGGVGRHGDPQGAHGLEGQLADFRSRGVGFHTHHTKLVDRHLEDNHAQGRHGGLERHSQADGKMLEHQRPGDPEILLL